MRLPQLKSLRRYFPVIAFFAGFIWDALTIGQRVRTIDFWRLGIFLGGAAILIIYLSRLSVQPQPAVADPQERLQHRLAGLTRLLPFLLLQFFFGGIFSALFILYFKSAGHVASWLGAAILGGLLIGNEFLRDRYARQLSLTWAMFALNAILLVNFALPYALGSLDGRWFYVSTLGGALLTHALWRFGAARHGRIVVAWGLAGVLLLAWQLDMIAPVPLVRKDLAIGQGFTQQSGQYVLQVESAPAWQFWREQSKKVHLAEGQPLYAVSAVFAPRGIAAQLEHRWEYRNEAGWQLRYRNQFQVSGGREGGFRGYSWVSNPQPGAWRVIVATPDGRTVAVQSFSVVRGDPAEAGVSLRRF